MIEEGCWSDSGKRDVRPDARHSLRLRQVDHAILMLRVSNLQQLPTESGGSDTLPNR